MDMDELVRKYINAWNQLDVPGLLDLMHPGAAYYDAFWAETCVGRDLAPYFRDAMEEEPFWYERVGGTIRTENGVTFRYSAHPLSGSTIGEPVHFGAEILNVRHGKILTVTDIYCSSDESHLARVAELAAHRHGLPRHANSGLGALKMARIKAGLSASLEEDKDYLDPNITISQLAEKIGCKLDQLSVVIEKEFGTSAGKFLDTQRVEYSRVLLRDLPDGSNTFRQVAESAGFQSVTEFRKKFAEIIGVTPKDYCRQKTSKQPSRDKSTLN